MNAPHLKPLPYNIEAEEALLGSLMIDPFGIARVPFLQDGHFYRDSHKALFRVLRRLGDDNAPLDPVTVTDMAATMGELAAIGGPAAITAPFTRVPTAVHLDHYARIVFEHAMRRAAIEAGEKVARKAYEIDGRDIIHLRRDMEAAAAGIVPMVNHPALDNAALAGRIIEQVKETHLSGVAPLLPCNITPLAEQIHGWERNRVTVLGALSSVGKTSFAVAEAVALAEQGYHVAFVNVEIDAPALVSRFLSHIGALDETQIIRGFLPHDVPPPGKDNYPFRRYSQNSVEQSLTDAAETFAALPISIVARDYDADPPEEPDFTPAGIVARLKKLDAARAVDFVIIDHLYILQYAATGDAYKMSGEYGETIMAFRKFAEYSGCHALILHQLDPQKALQLAVPNAACFPGSQRIWQNTDNLIALYAPASHDRAYTDKRARAFNVIKARRGVTGVVSGIRFDGAVSNFTVDAPPVRSVHTETEPDIEF